MPGYKALPFFSLSLSLSLLLLYRLFLLFRTCCLLVRRSPRRTLLKRILTIFEKFFRKYDTKIFVTTDEIFHQHPNDIFPLSEKRTRWIALRLTTIIYLRENVSVVIENRDSRKEEENDTSDVTHSNKIYRLNKFNKGPLLIHSPMQPRCPPLSFSLYDSSSLPGRRIIYSGNRNSNETRRIYAHYASSVVAEATYHLRLLFPSYNF